MFDIRFDTAKRILYLTISGFWDRATALRFAAELGDHVARISGSGKDFTCLSDARLFPPQSAATGFTRLGRPERSAPDGFPRLGNSRTERDLNRRCQ